MGRGAVEGGGAGVCPGGSTERLRLRSRSSPRDEERECCLLVLNLVSSTLPCIRQPIDVGRRRATAGDTAPRAGYCPSPPRAPGPWSWSTGYSPALWEVGTLVPALLPVLPTTPGLRPRRPRPAAAVERASFDLATCRSNCILRCATSRHAMPCAPGAIMQCHAHPAPCDM